MDIATGPLGTLLPKLAQLLHEEYKMQKGAKEGIQFLHKELEFMHAVLKKVGEVPSDQLDEPRRIWARDVKELSYDMEDIVDTFIVDIEGPDPPSKRGVKKIFKKMMRKVNKFLARREVSNEINAIKERAEELAKRRQRYMVDDITPAKKITVDPRLNVLYTDASKIVGIEEAKEEVITMLTGGDDDQKKRIVSIAGFGGLGKTTLAKAVYDEIKNDFGCTAFISVSSRPDPKKILWDMLYDFDKEACKNINSTMLDQKRLTDSVREILGNKRYLIVIDDIWNSEPWDEVIKTALIENYMSSRIITTTRNIVVAEHIGGCYKLKELSDESSEMLFYGRIFGSKDKCPRQFTEVSKKILKKCGGVPLAIVTTSSMLANKSENIKVWNHVCDSIGSGLGTTPVMDDMMKILLLSYYDLPSHLKTCLLYLSIFPEDYKIYKDQLIWRWVAEGFVQQSQQQPAGRGQNFLEIGENYFNELLNRSLIQPADMDDMDGTPRACRVHDIVLDLVSSLSRKECFVTTILEDGSHDQARWLSLHNNTTWPTMKMPKLRSLTIFKPDVVVIDPTPSLSCYLLLRVLDLRRCKLKDLASIGFLGSLSHLRYLALSSSNTDACDQLPVEIGKLRFLQMLDLFGTTVIELPSSVVTGLEQLVCLQGSWKSTYLPAGLKNLTSLEVLQRVAVASEDIIAEDLVHLTQLRVLEVQVMVADRECDGWNACAEALVESLGKLTKMESLIIYHNSYEIDFNGPMEEQLGNLQRLCIWGANIMPAWIESTLLPIISYLNIDVAHGESEDIELLSMLPCLRHLTYRVGYGTDDMQRICVVGPNAFPSAIWCKFDIFGPGGVVPCTFQGGAMPKLQDFTFRIDPEQFCSGGGFTLDDLGLGHIPSLRSVTVLCLQSYKDDNDVITSTRTKLEQEAAAHPTNRPLRIEYDNGI